MFEPWADLSAIGPQTGNLTVNDANVGKAHLFDEKDILVKLNCNFTRGFSVPGMYSQLLSYCKSKKKSGNRWRGTWIINKQNRTS